MLEFWGMQSTPSLPLFPGPLLPGVVVPDRDLSMGHIELFDISTECQQMTCYVESLEIKLFDHLNVCINKMCLQIMYLIYM